jgi:hypothetical protein
MADSSNHKDKHSKRLNVWLSWVMLRPVFIASFSFFCAAGIALVPWLFFACLFRLCNRYLSRSLRNKALSECSEIATEQRLGEYL